MKHPVESAHNRTQFQIDRIAFFSDAVIAIGLTLMILEIKIPDLGKDSTVKQIFDQFGMDLFMHAIALFVGFSTISNLWIQHHKLFEHIVKYNERLIQFNLYFLFTVMLLPISISFVFNTHQPVYLKFLFYFSNLFLCNLMYYLMLFLIFSKKNRFSVLENQEQIDGMKSRSLLSSIMFGMANLLLILQVKGWYWVFFLMPAYRIYQGIMKKSSRGKRQQPGDLTRKNG